MRIPTILACLALFLILAPGCESTGGSTPSKSNDAGATREPVEPPISAKGVTNRPIRMEWRDLNPRHQRQIMGLINRSSPDLAVLLYGKKDKASRLKPVEDDVMANMLSALRETEFFDLATKGVTADRFKVGDGHGVVWVQIGDENWSLLFSPATGAAESALPRTYRDAKVLIVNVWGQTLWFAPSTSGGSESLRIEPHKYEQPKR